MKYGFIISFLVVAWWQVVQPVLLVDYEGTPAKVKIYNNTPTTFTFQFQNFGAMVNGTGYSPYCYVAATATNRNPISATCAWTITTAGVFTATFGTNGLPADGSLWIYGCGLSNTTTGAKTTFNQGEAEIRRDPWR